MFTSDAHLAKPVQPVSGPLLVVMALVVVATCLLGVGSLLSSFWQDAGQWPVSPATLGTSGDLLGAALTSLIGLLAPMALGCVVLLQNQQLRFEPQQLAHARYEFAIEAALNQRSRPVRTPLPSPEPISHPATTGSANLEALPAGDPSADTSGLVNGVETTLQQTHLTTLAAIRAVDAAIKICQQRLSHGAGEAEAHELQHLVSRLHRRLQRLEHDAATDLKGSDHE